MFVIIIWLQDQVIGFLQDVFNFSRVRYSSVEDMAADVWILARQRREAIALHMSTTVSWKKKEMMK